MRTLRPLPFVIAVLALTLSPIGRAQQSHPNPVGPAGRTWNGSGGTNKWSTAGNWNLTLIPTGHETVAFPAVASKTANNDLNLDDAANNVEMVIGASDYSIGGNVIPTCQVQTTYTSGLSFIAAAIEQNNACAGATDVDVASGGTLVLTGWSLVNTLNIVGPGRVLIQSATGAPGLHYAISNGTLGIQSDKSASDATVTGGVLSGSGTIGNVTMTGGTISPEATVSVFSVGSAHTLGLGGTTAILHTGNINANAASTFAMRIAGTVAGTGYDQLAVTGSVSLGNATLALTVAGAIAPGSVIRLIDNDGVDPIVGTFAGLAEGATATLGGITGTISYAGGTGNDMTFSVTAGGLTPGISIAPGTLPALTVGTAVNQTLTASGGTAPYVYTVTGGALPAGLSLSAGGVLSGTPTTAGAYSVTITATDNVGGFNTAAYSGTVAASVPALPAWMLALVVIAMITTASVALGRTSQHVAR